MLKKRWFIMTLVMTLLAGPLSLIEAQETAAAVTRVAVVKELKGTVDVKKAGGKKAFKAFNNMSLNEGDQITTGAGAKVVLELASDKADQDKITIGENSQVDFTKLSETEGTKTKMNVWAGSMWVKVKSISNASDTFEVETPTAIMGVRGTNFAIQVDPNTGLTNMVAVSGIVSSNIRNLNNQNVLIYPSQQIVLNTNEKKVDYGVAIIDVNEFISQVSPAIIEEIIKNAADIQKENEQLKEKLQQQIDSSGTTEVEDVKNISELDRYKIQLDNIIGNIAKEAIESKKIDAKRIEDLVNEANRDPGIIKPIDLNKVEKPALTEEQLRKQEELRRLEAAQKLKQEQQRAVLEVLKQQQAEVLRRVEEQKKRIEEANRQAAEAAKKAAEDKLMQQLSEAARIQFEAAKKAAEAQNTPTTPTPTPIPIPNNPPVPTVVPRAALAFDGYSGASRSITLNTIMQEPMLINVNLSQFTGLNAIAGFQIKLEYDSKYMHFNDEVFDEAKPLFRSGHGKFVVDHGNTSGSNSVDHYTFTSNYDDEIVPNSVKDTVFYSLAKFNGPAVAFDATPSKVVQIPFYFALHQMAPGTTYTSTIRIKEIIAVDGFGDPIGSINSSGELTVNVSTSISILN